MGFDFPAKPRTAVTKVTGLPVYPMFSLRFESLA